jgi:hypothetical protein
MVITYHVVKLVSFIILNFHHADRCNTSHISSPLIVEIGIIKNMVIS